MTGRIYITGDIHGSHDAPTGRLPDLCADQASPGVQTHAGSHAVQQGRSV